MPDEMKTYYMSNIIYYTIQRKGLLPESMMKTIQRRQKNKPIGLI